MRSEVESRRTAGGGCGRRIAVKTVVKLRASPFSRFSHHLLPIFSTESETRMSLIILLVMMIIIVMMTIVELMIIVVMMKKVGDNNHRGNCD